MSLLAGIVGLLLPSPVDRAKAAVSPNPYAPSLPVQFSVAIGQQVRAGVQAPLSGLTGSEADYAAEQVSGNAAIGSLTQWVPGRSLPPSMFTPRLPDGAIGQGTGYVAGNSYKGWVLPITRKVWGASTRTVHYAQAAVNSTLLDPRTRSPLPRDMEAAYIAAHQKTSRLEDSYGSDS